MKFWNNERWELQEKQGLFVLIKCQNFSDIHLHFVMRLLILFFSSFFVPFLKLSWPKTLVKKWFNIKNRAEDFQADDDDYEGD